MIFSSAGWDILTGLLPFVLLFGFWIFLMKRVRSASSPGQDALIEKLDEIRDELRRLREAVEAEALTRR
jgi:hypothetical protein